MAEESTQVPAPPAEPAVEADGGSDWKAYALPGAIIIAAIVLAGAMLSASGSLVGQMKTLETTINGIECGGSGPVIVPTMAPATPTPAPAGPVNVDTSGRPFTGNPNGQVLIVAFSDFQCPYCSRAAATMNQILGNYSGKIKYVHMNFPLPFHENAQKAAEAFECAAKQDSDKAYKLHDAMFARQSNLTVPELKTYAAGVGLDTAAFNTCLDTDATAALVTAQMDLGSSKGISGTPTFLINGVEVVGAQPYSVFKQAVDAALAGSG